MYSGKHRRSELVDESHEIHSQHGKYQFEWLCVPFWQFSQKRRAGRGVGSLYMEVKLKTKVVSFVTRLDRKARGEGRVRIWKKWEEQ